MPITSLVILVLFVDICFGKSFNQPKLSSCAAWNTSAITVANESIIGQQSFGIFVNTKNNLYITHRHNNQILIWNNGLFTRNITISSNLTNAWGLFVSDKDDIYVDKWIVNGTNSTSMIYSNSSCTGLFLIDISNTLYCSSANQHRVLRIGLDSGTSVSVAGTGCPGPVTNMLDHPHGIFVDEKLNLFVADTDNNRIQRFEPGQFHAMTVAGFGALIVFILKRPRSIVVDGDGYLFIVDSGNNRIIRSVSNGYECLFGCSKESGSSASALNNPQMMAFDKDGHIIVSDVGNRRIQKFVLARNSCVMAYSSLTLYCGCSGFNLSLNNISLGINAIYQWQSSPIGLNTWSNINMDKSSSSLFIASQFDSTDYHCQIIVLSPTPMNLTSTVVTVMTTTNTSYCQTYASNCKSDGDDIDNFILIGELGTQIRDLSTNCLENAYDNQTQQSVSLYMNTTYTAQVSSRYNGGGEQLAIWIDFNNKFQFESSEQVASQLLNTIVNTDVVIAIPSSSMGAKLRVHRMRATVAHQAIPNPCGTSDKFGETHDYTVNILSPSAMLYHFSAVIGFLISHG